jgi:hypothetical protein
MAKLAFVKKGIVVSVVGREVVDQNAGKWVDATGIQGVKPGWTWDGTVFAAPVAPVYKKIRTEAFWERFTNNELVDIDVAMQHNPADTNNAKKAAAKLRIFKADADASGYRKLDANKVTSFVQGLEPALIAAGRAATILNTPITADEAYIE